MQTGQVELPFRIVIADCPRIFRGQNPIGADNLPRILVTHDQMFTIGIENVLIDARHLAGQTGTKFLGKNTIAQFLRGKNFAVIDGQTDGQ